jgi:Secretion system C-terminal sorting domain
VDVADAGVTTMYPNPVNDILNINCDLSIVNSKLIITDMMGKVVMTETITTDHSTFNIQHLSSGVYFVKVGNVVKKIVKE